MYAVAQGKLAGLDGITYSIDDNKQLPTGACLPAITRKKARKSKAE